MAVSLQGERAVKVFGTKLTETPRAYYMDCEGDQLWIPKSVCKLVPKDKAIVIKEWWYNQNFTNS
jgi:hypothetical protein